MIQRTEDTPGQMIQKTEETPGQMIQMKQRRHQDR